MTVGGVSSNYACNVDFSKLYGTNPNCKTSSKNLSASSDNDQYVKGADESQEVCTDGKDDGKIGFFGAVKNIVKGAGKGIVNAVKGCFTNNEGKFSVGKTLLTLGMGAVCVAFPAVGLAACAVGAVSGAVKLGSGVVKAVNAETDAEAKDAWQNVGEGGLTVAASVVGAKASAGALKSSSTAGLAGLDDAAAAIAKTEGKTSALSQLDDGASVMEKLSALSKDALSSTKNNFKSIKDDASAFLNTAKDINKLNKMRRANADALAKQNAGETLTPEELKSISDWENLSASDYSAKAISKVNKQNTKEYLENNLKEAKISKNAENIKSASAELKEFKNENSSLRSGISKLKNSAKDTTGKVVESVKHPKSSIKTAGAKVISGIKNSKNLPNEALSKLSSGGKAVYEAITKTDASYNQLVQEYGYENVLEVMKVLGGYAVTDETI